MGEPELGEEVPVCPRHPDQVSYVRCQRCERPTCPQCQRPAAVGVQCVDCVYAGARATAPRTTFGSGRVATRPWATLTIIVICVVAYLLQRTVPGFSQAWAFAPFIGVSEPWRFLTSAFLHSSSGFLHIVLNMIALWAIGPYLEQTLGWIRFTALYLLSAVAGSAALVMWAAFADQWTLTAVGASGAVFGLFGAVMVVLRRVGRNATGMMAVIAINVVIGFVLPGIAWQAHLGGLLVGALLGGAYAYAPPERRTVVSVTASIAVAVIVLVVAVGTYSAAGRL